MDSIFKRTLRTELDYQDVKVKELSVRTGISARTLEGYLNARGSIPPADVAVKIAQALNVSVEYLVTGDASFNMFSKQKNTYQNTIEENISILPVGKKTLLKDFISLLNSFEVTKK